MQTEATKVALQLNKLSWPQQQAVRKVVETLLFSDSAEPITDILRSTTFMTDLAEVLSATEKSDIDEDFFNETGRNSSQGKGSPAIEDGSKDHTKNETQSNTTSQPGDTDRDDVERKRDVQCDTESDSDHS
ncbi:hypothetical protein VNI00_018028 [Paramarasmius palmivorus]|uniref:Uncharacterized protein n=1 Tax=Paramarasmius palmivorus TaxID=297713 RepID=A0AAW0B151_9AGAR